MTETQEGKVWEIRWFRLTDFEMSDPVCDFCNEDLKEFPRPVFAGHALCKKCQNALGITPGDTEYFESWGLLHDIEPKKVGVNCGGRRRDGGA